MDAATRTRWFWPVVAALLVLHAALSLTALRRQGPTFDEPAHLVAGHASWQGDRRMAPEAGALPLRWAALGLDASSLPALDTASDAYRQARAYVVAREWLFARSEDGMRALQRARAMMIVVPLATGLLIALWSRRLFGDAGAVLSLVAWVACPTVIGHGALVTMDATATLLLSASALALWGLVEKPTAARALLAGGCAGTLLLTKLTWVLLPPLALTFLAARWLAGQRAMARPIVGLAGAIATAWLVLWAGYCFESKPIAPERAADLADAFPWDEVLARCGPLTRNAVELARAAHLAPEPWLLGNAFTLQSLSGRLSFLEGRWSDTGFWWFFPWLFVLKTRGPTLVACALALVALLRGREALRSRTWLATPVVPAVAVLGWHLAACVSSATNIGYRHFMPALPAIFVLIGAAGAWLVTTRAGRLALIALVAADVGFSVAVWPDYIASFNACVAPGRGYRKAVDSSSDWGQALPALRDWMALRDVSRPLYLAWFGSVLPQHFGITARALPSRAEVRIGSLDTRPLEPGTYVFSATLLQRVHARFPGPWTPELDALWVAARDVPPGPSPAPGESLHAWQDRADAYTDLRAGRLASVLRERVPSDVIAGSLVVFELSAEDLEAALDRPLP